MTDPVSALGRTIAAIRQGATKTSAVSRMADAAGAQAKTAIGRVKPSRLAALPERIRAQGLATSAEERRQTLTLFVEAVLLDAFGDELESDPDFLALVDRVVSAVDGDTGLTQQVDQAIEELKTGS